MKIFDNLFKKKKADFPDPAEKCKQCRKYETTDCPDYFHCFVRFDKPEFEKKN